MENPRNKEDLNELLKLVLPVKKEIAFYNFIADLSDPQEYIQGPEEYWSGPYLLASSIRKINKILQIKAKNSLPYTLAEAGYERAKVLAGYDQSAFIQQIYDFRKKLLDEIPELEQLFLERL